MHSLDMLSVRALNNYANFIKTVVYESDEATLSCLA